MISDYPVKLSRKPKTSLSSKLGEGSSVSSNNLGSSSQVGPGTTQTTTDPSKSKTFIGTVDVNAATAKMRFVEIAEDIIALLASDAKANVRVSMEISADFSVGVSDQIKRAVSENAASLGFKNRSWE